MPKKSNTSMIKISRKSHPKLFGVFQEHAQNQGIAILHGLRAYPSEAKLAEEDLQKASDAEISGFIYRGKKLKGEFARGILESWTLAGMNGEL